MTPAMSDKQRAELLELADGVVREMHSVLTTKWDRDCLRAKTLNALYQAAALREAAKERSDAAQASPHREAREKEITRLATIETCARELETSYPGHAWLNAACAAIRSLSVSSADREGGK